MLAVHAQSLNIDVNRMNRETQSFLDVKFDRILDAFGDHADANAILDDHVDVDNNLLSIDLHLNAAAVIP